jgi:uncharacterized protein YciI
VPICLLSYEYVEDILERRGPHREAHLAHIREFSSGRSLVVAGAVGDPPSGGLFVFESGGDPSPEAEEFADSDPYVRAGLVTSRRIEPWAVVANSWMTGPGTG